MLQQILFFRELEFPLNHIRQILTCNDFDKIKTLQEHKSLLQSQVLRTTTLIETLEKTILHLRGQYKMPIEEMFEGFDPKKQQEHEQYMIETGLMSQQQIDESWQRAAHWKKPDWEQFKARGEKLHLDLVALLEQGEKVDSKKVQQLIQAHFDWVSIFWTPTKDTYLGLGQMYLEHPDFRDFYRRFHPDLAEYIVAAMKVFAEEQLI